MKDKLLIHCNECGTTGNREDLKGKNKIKLCVMAIPGDTDVKFVIIDEGTGYLCFKCHCKHFKSVKTILD